MQRESFNVNTEAKKTAIKIEKEEEKQWNHNNSDIGAKLGSR